MRRPAYFAALLSLAAGFLAVSAGGKGSKPSHTTPGKSSRDTCANLDGALTYPNGTDIGTVDTCLCVSEVPIFIKSGGNAIVAESITANGYNKTKVQLEGLVRSANDTQKCTFPDNSVSQCATDNPCAFACINGFTAEPAGAPDKCVCKSPNTVCNGVCKPNCPTPSRRSGYHVPLRKRAACPVGWTACGVYERRGAKSDPWECVNTKSDLESCGGCTTPLDLSSPRGVDCTAIPGVVDVSCNHGKCEVRRCADGYAVSADGSSCVRKRTLLNQA